VAVKVVTINSVGEVTFMQNSRSKRIRMRVRPGRKILISFPLFVSFREAARFAEQHADWITNQHQKFETITPKYSEDTVIQTRFHKITFRRYGEKLTVKQNHEDIEIAFPDTYLLSDQKMQQFFHRVLTEIYRREAKQYLPPRLSDLARR
jgi:predicted metal-dependent hydrolase